MTTHLLFLLQRRKETKTKYGIWNSKFACLTVTDEWFLKKSDSKTILNEAQRKVLFPLSTINLDLHTPKFIYMTKVK